MVRPIMPVLRDFPLFHGVDTTSLADIEAMCRLRNYEKEETITHIDDDAHSAVFVYGGLVRRIVMTDSGKEASLSNIQQQECFGAEAILGDGIWHYSAEAARRSICILMPKHVLLKAIEKPIISRNMFAILSRELTISHEAFVDMLRPVDERIMKALRKRVKNGMIDQASASEISIETNAARETVSRVMSALGKAGVIIRKNCRSSSVMIDTAKLDSCVIRWESPGNYRAVISEKMAS